jgi:hypothetical protein
MSNFVRATFLASLTFLLAHFALPERSSQAERGADSETGIVRVQHVPHPATSGARTFLTDRLVHGDANAPFALTAAFDHAVICSDVIAPEPVTSGAGLDADVLLPPSRAPPAHS